MARRFRTADPASENSAASEGAARRFGRLTGWMGACEPDTEAARISGLIREEADRLGSLDLAAPESLAGLEAILHKRGWLEGASAHADYRERAAADFKARYSNRNPRSGRRHP